MGKFIVILVLIVIVILVIKIYRRSDYNISSTYEYEMHDRIENGMFYIILTDELFCGQSFWVSDKYYHELSEHPALDVEYMQIKDKAAVKRVSCPYIKEKNIAKKWN